MVVRRGWFAASMVVLASLCAPSANASLAFNATGPNDATTSFSILSNGGYGVSFTTSNDYLNVDFTVNLANFFQSTNINLAVFLTNQVGAGTTAAANEIASAALSGVAISSSPVNFPYTITTLHILALASLPAGTYFLTINESSPNPDPGYIVSSPNANAIITLDPGVTLNANMAFGGAPAGYLPASGYGAQADINYWFSMTGDQVPNVPEPATIGMTLAGLAGFVLTRARRSRKVVFPSA